ncbi:unnamed protein product [Adineta steineri]|uniref:NAD(P)(+)--arginine ADP-ribosyltransferase n=1 Tax=Adineta steineri TaxID=433720 RepID=A0A818N893_9BILA|nr:unnamed protein product [Adineta steineri]
MPQLDAIYIFADNRSRYQEWTQNWTKIKGVHTNIKYICEALQSAVKQCDQDSIAISFHSVDEMASLENLNQLEPTFMYTQIFKEILLDMKHDEQAIKQFIAYCRNNNRLSPNNINNLSSKNIDRFEREYHPQSAIRWYTSPTNICSMLNYALRTLDADPIITMGFFICHLHQEIQQLHEQQANRYGRTPFSVYRGQGLLRSESEKLQKTKGGLMSFNSFLSTSSDREVSLDYAQCASINPDMVGILFIMSIDPCIKSTPFAFINDVSDYNEEQEILFSMHTVFRVGTIERMDNENELYQVKLQLTSDDDQQLRVLTDRIREEASAGTGWQRLGSLLRKIGQFNKAEKLYNVLLEQTSDEDEQALYYNQLGLVHSSQGDYQKAISYHEQTLEIDQKTLPSNHPDLATSYTNIGNVYDKMGQYSKALSFHKKALEIDQETLPPNLPNLATSYSRIGSVYDNMGEYLKALSYHEKALEIYQKALPSNHPHLATSYCCIGNVYESMGEYSKALSFHDKAFEIYQKALPSNHPSLATSYNNIGLVYDKMGECSKALSLYEQALEIYQKALLSNHPDLATTYSNIGRVYSSTREYSKALLYYEKALKIREKALPSNHPDLATLYNNIGRMYYKMGEYSKALSFYEQALEIDKETLSSNHPDLATSYNNIANVYYKMGEYSKALSFYEKDLNISQQSLSSNDPDLATSYSNIGTVYSSMGEYSKALSYHKKDLEICEKTLSSNHPDLATTYNNIGKVYNQMGEYSKALSFYEQALEIDKETLSSNHANLATSYNNIDHPDLVVSYNIIGWVYRNMKDYSKALSYLEHALDILKRALPAHPHTKSMKKSIEIVKEEMKKMI